MSNSSTDGQTPPEHYTLEDLTAVLDQSWKLIKLSMPEKIHYGFTDGSTACVKGGDNTVVQVWGEYVTNKKEDVGCQFCREWMYS